MSTHQVHVFISHSWAYSGHYSTLCSWIFGEKWSSGQASIDFRNFSVPIDDPIHNAPTVGLLRMAIHNQIKRCHVIVIPSGMYATHSRWIQEEISGCGLHSKPIVAVRPWGQQREAKVVTDAARSLVNWNKQSVIDAIWGVYYQGGSKRA